MKGVNFEVTAFKDHLHGGQNYRKQVQRLASDKIASEALNQGDFDYSDRFDTRLMVTFTVDTMIVNNQLVNTQFPVMVAPTTKKKKNEKTPLLSFNLYSKGSSEEGIASTLRYITHLTFFMDTLEVRTSNIMLEALLLTSQQLDFMFSRTSKKAQNFNLLVNFDYKKLFEQRVEEEIVNNPSKGTRVYMNLMNIEPMQLILTFTNSPGYKMSTLATSLLADFGLNLASIDSARIKFNSIKAHHIFLTAEAVVNMFIKHYTRQFWTQLYKIIGSVELLGSPVSVIGNLGTGIVDIFYEPLYSLATGQRTRHGHKFGKALVYGAVSLVSHSVTGISEALNKMTKSIVKIIASLSFDRDWLQRRQAMKLRVTKSARAGLRKGGSFFLRTVWEALSGVVKRPYHEAKIVGFKGIFSGLFKGVMGLAIKPTIALYDFLFSLFEGLKNSAKYEEQLMDKRSRPRRTLEENPLTRPFDYESALAREIIRSTKYQPKYGEVVKFFDLVNITKSSRWLKTRIQEYYVVLTNLRFYFINKKTSECIKLKLFIIDKVVYVKETHVLQFHLYIPLKRKANPLILPYESLDRAVKLLDYLKLLKIHAEITELDENVRSGRIRRGHLEWWKSKKTQNVDPNDLEINYNKQF